MPSGAGFQIWKVNGILRSEPVIFIKDGGSEATIIGDDFRNFLLVNSSKFQEYVRRIQFYNPQSMITNTFRVLFDFVRTFTLTETGCQRTL